MPITESSLRRRVPLIAALAALALCLCAPQALARYVYTGNYADSTLSVIDTATNQVVGSPIPTGAGPNSIAITPNGRTLYVTSGSGDITVVNTQTNQVITTITGLPGLETIAISPDGRTAYASSPEQDEVLVIDLQTNQVAGPPIEVGEGPVGVVFSPDGKVAFAVNFNDDDVSVIDTATRQVVGGPIPVGIEPSTAVVSPDGKTLFVSTEEGGGTISVIDTATKQVVGAPITVGQDPWGLGLSPDGARLYVSNTIDNNVSVIDTATRQVIGAPIPTGAQPYELAVTPDGKSVYVANYEGGGDGMGSVTVIDTQTNQADTFPVPGGPWQVAIVPDQSPTASFTAAATKQPFSLAFSGLGSTDPDGTIARYDWSFGDGATLAGGGPAPTHSYAKAGTYSASLTVTDNEGCSVNMVFTGRTALCSGSSAATRTQSVTVTANAPKAPNNFKFGKLKRNLRKGTAKLTVRVPTAGKLIVSGKKVKRAQRSANKAGKVVLNIRPKAKAKKQLAAEGSAKVRVRITFSPVGGDKLTKSKALKLIKR